MGSSGAFFRFEMQKLLNLAGDGSSSVQMLKTCFANVETAMNGSQAVNAASLNPSNEPMSQSGFHSISEDAVGLPWAVEPWRMTGYPHQLLEFRGFYEARQSELRQKIVSLLGVVEEEAE